MVIAAIISLQKNKHITNRLHQISCEDKLWTPPINPFFQLLYARTWERTKNQLLNRKLHHASVFNKTFRSARFWNKNCTKCQILNPKKNASAFELKCKQGDRFWIKSFSNLQIFKKKYVQKITFRFLSLRENNNFCIIFMLFERHHFEFKTLQRVRFSIDRKYNV